MCAKTAKELWILKLKTLLYISFLIHPKYPPHYFLWYLYYFYLELKARNPYLDVIPCPTALIEFYLNKYVKQSFDTDNCIVVSKQVSDKLVSNSFNLLTVHSKCNENEPRIVHAIGVPNMTKGEILMSEVLYHNINKTEYSSKMRLTGCSSKLVKIAKEFEICLINTEHEISNELVDTLLKAYFKIPRIVYKYDIMCVKMEQYGPEYLMCSAPGSDVGTLFFKCRKISSNKVEDSLNGYFCVMGETSLKQSANIRAYLPPSIFQLRTDYNLKESDHYEHCIISKCPHGLESYLKKIEKAVHPFLPKNKLNLYPAFLIQGNKGVGKNIIIRALAAKLGVHIFQVECSDIQTSTHAQTESKLRNAFIRSKLTAPCFLVLNHFQIFGKDGDDTYDPRLVDYFASELKALFEDNNFPIILFCLCDTKDIDPSLARVFLETFTIDTPDQNQRTSMLRWLARSKDVDVAIDLSEIAAKTHGFVFQDLDALIYHALKNWYLQTNAQNNEVCLRSEDFEKALDFMQKLYATSLGAPKVPKVFWSDVGGLHSLKREIIRTINLPLQHPNLLKITGLKRSGILLFGPPGTGKTLIAKAVATECGLCFLSVKGPELLNMYVGQSEQNVREVFRRARDASPCIIFFDELDSLAPNRGLSGDSGGVMDRVVSQLLSEMDGLNLSGTVFIIGATNRPDLLDPALLRPGRFDKLIYVGPCTDEDTKLSVLKALTRKFVLSPDVKLSKIVCLCRKNVTGADLSSVCTNAWFSAVRRTIKSIESGKLSKEQLSLESVRVTMKDFSTAIKNLEPSVSDEDMKYYQTLVEESAKNDTKKN